MNWRKKPRKKRSIIYSISREEFAALCKKSDTLADIIRSFGLHAGAGNYGTLKRRIKEEGVDISHIALGAGSSKGKTRPREGLGADVMLVKDCEHSRGALRNLIKREKLLEYRCQICGLGPEWGGLALTLRLDHINGARRDNRIDNLRYVCPNCDTQLPTYCAKNRRPRNKCPDCGKEIRTRSARCKPCNARANPQKTKIAWPEIDDLWRMTQETSNSEVARRLGVAFNTVKKRLRRAGLV